MINDTVEGRPSPNKSNEEEEYYTLLKKVFHLLAPYYDALFALLSFGGESRLRKKVVEFAGAGLNSRILDIATGTGGQAFAFAAKSHQVVGIDLSEDMLKVAKKKNAFE